MVFAFVLGSRYGQKVAAKLLAKAGYFTND
jgi:hypothetical protein